MPLHCFRFFLHFSSVTEEVWEDDEDFIHLSTRTSGWRRGDTSFRYDGGWTQEGKARKMWSQVQVQEWQMQAQRWAKRQGQVVTKIKAAEKISIKKYSALEEHI